MTNKKKKLVSIVTPVLNEEDNVNFYYKKICETIDKLSDSYDFEIVVTDNASTDKTYELFEKIAKKDKRLRLFRFSRNFGFQRSIYTGYAKAKGDCAIEFDCDLQDDPSLLPEFLKHWEEGNKIVYGIRNKRPEGKLINATRKIYYRLIHKISSYKLPVDAGDFMLIDRMILDNIKNTNDKNPYIRGMVFSMGFQQKGIPYARDERLHGKTKFPLTKLIGLAVDGIVSQSVLPLRIASYVGFATSAITVCLILFYSVLRIFTEVNWPEGFTTTAVLILFSICLNAIFLGIIGEYLLRIYMQVQNLPITIIEKEIDNNTKK